MYPVRFFLSCLVLCIMRGSCLPSGPPLRNPTEIDLVCNELRPAGHEIGQNVDQPGNGGFTVGTDLTLNALGTGFNYEAGISYSIQIMAQPPTTFLGFLIQARNVPGGQPIGTFTPTDNLQQVLACPDALGTMTSATAAHSNANRVPFSVVSLMWQAPEEANGTVDFLYTIVVQFPTFFVARSAAAVLFNQFPNGVINAQTAPEDFRLIARDPLGCEPSACNIFVGISTNPGNESYLDFYIEGQAEGWVAAGFSLTPNMFSADVLGCSLDPITNMVEVLDTWNEPPNNRSNTLDQVQDIITFNTSSQGGRIACTFARLTAGTLTVPQEDLDLNGDYYVLYGLRPDPNLVAGGGLPVHVRGPAGNPNVSVQTVNPTIAAGAIGEVTIFPDGIIDAQIAPEEYRLIVRDPLGCEPSACNIFVGISTNPGNSDYLDFYIEGQAEGWVAAGFSLTPNMFSADVLGCSLDPITNMVEVLDTWNEAPNNRSNTLDQVQDIITFNTSSQNGRITCTFTRLTTGTLTDPQEDLDLNGDYYVLYGVRPGPNATAAGGGLSAHVLGPAGNPNVSAETVNPTTAAGAIGEVIVFPNGVIDAQIAPEEFRLTARDPDGCEPSACDIFVGISTNPGNDSYLDFYIEGQAEGWVAAGFSLSPNMFSADVLGCSLNPITNMVEVLDTWNEAPNTRLNTLDQVQDIITFNTNSQNGRITCTFARLTTGTPTDPQEDLDLNGDYYIMYGVRPGPTSAGGGLLSHDLGAGNPAVSAQTVNPTTAEGEIGSDQLSVQLTRAHGALMIIAWPLMAVSAIFFAAWMRPALPNGEWFQVHRFLMIGSILVASVGFLLIFVANRNGSPPGLITLGSTNIVGTAHYAIGIIVMFLHFLNPLISACRCKPDGKYRWIFNIIHGTAVGMVAELLALSNVGIGLALFSERFSRFMDLTILYVYLGYVGFFLTLIMILFLIFIVTAYTSSDDTIERKSLAPSLVKPLVPASGANGPNKPPPTSQGVELDVLGNTSSQSGDDDLKKRKPPSRDAPVRWLSLLVFMVVAVIFTVVLVIMVAAT